jgi:hypothetical protein
MFKGEGRPKTEEVGSNQPQEAVGNIEVIVYLVLIPT